MKSFVREYPKNAVIFHEGEVGNAAYILTEGTVEITVQGSGKKSVVGMLSPVAVFGEMALLLKDQKRTATATVKVDAKVAEICKKDFEDFIEQSPKLIGAILNTLVERLKRTTTKVSQAPDLFLGIAEILNLLQQHSAHGVKYEPMLRLIKYEPTFKAIMNAFLVSQGEVKGILDNMETLGLIEMRMSGDERFIEIIKKTDFLERCQKIHVTFSKLAAIE